MRRALPLLALASLCAALGWSGVYLRRQATQRLSAELRRHDAALTWSRVEPRGGHLVLRDVRATLRRHHARLSAARLVIEPPARWGAPPSLRFEDVDVAAAARGHRVWGHLEQIALRRAACGIVASARGGRLHLLRGDTPAETPRARAAPARSPVCRAEARRVEVALGGPDRRALAATVSGGWTPGLLDARLEVGDGAAEVLVWLGGDVPHVSADLRDAPLEPLLRHTPLASVISGRLSGRLVAAIGPDVVADVDLDWRGGLDHPGLHHRPVDGFEAALAGRLRRDVDGRVEISAPRARLGDAEARLDARWDPHQRHLRLDAAVAPIPCQGAWRSLPAELRGPYRHARLSGLWSPRVHLGLPVDDAFELSFEVTGHDGCRVEHLAVPAAEWPQARQAGDRSDVDWLTRRFTRRVPEATREIIVGPGVRGYVPLSSLPAHVRAAMIVSEDMGFGKGKGVSLALIRRALMFNVSRRRFVYGGSTIPQQLVKNLFLSRQKTLARKLQEALVASRLADAVSPNRILELYVNCIEFAPNVYGIGAAARFYFQKSPSALSPKEAAFLAMAKPNPRYTAGMRARGETPDTPHFREYMRRILQRSADRGALSPAAVAAARPYRLRWRSGRSTAVDGKTK